MDKYANVTLKRPPPGPDNQVYSRICHEETSIMAVRFIAFSNPVPFLYAYLNGFLDILLL